jgi:hypothetical protein
MTQTEFLSYLYWFSAGLGILPQYTLAQTCIVNITELVNRGDAIYVALQQPASSVNLENIWVNSTLLLGNVSWTYQGCYLSTEGSITQLYYKIMSYESPQNYVLYLLPNMLSYAFVMN